MWVCARELASHSVLARPAVRAHLERSAPVDAVDRRAVELELAGEAYALAVGETTPHAVHPLADLLLAERVVEREHRLDVLERRERAVERGSDLPGRRSSRAQRREPLLERHELAVPGVELDVGYRRVREHVVAVAGVAHEPDELVVPTLRARPYRLGPLPQHATPDPTTSSPR